MDITSLRASRNVNTITELTKKLEDLQSNTRKEDVRFWKLEPDKAGNATATIRFLPTPENESQPFVRIFTHSFQDAKTKRWYIENSLSTIGEKDPVGELNSKLWNMGVEDSPERKLASHQKRRTHFISNIYVVNDPKNPDNNGKVFLFKYGKKIFDMWSLKLNPKFEDQTPMNVFDIWTGADFKLRMTKKDDFFNYDSSEFSPTSEFLGGDEEKILEALNSRHSLEAFLDKSNFKTYDELSQRLAFVIGEAEDNGFSTPQASAPATNKVEEDTPWEEESQPKSQEEPKVSNPVQSPASAPLEDDDDALDYFKNL